MAPNNQQCTHRAIKTMTRENILPILPKALSNTPLAITCIPFRNAMLTKALHKFKTKN